MALFQCSDDEIRLLKRLRALEADNFSRVLLGLKPMAILEKTDSRVEPIERPQTPTPPLPTQPGRV